MSVSESDCPAGRSNDGDLDADVVIVGCGPVGVSAANFLGQFGVRTVVLERSSDIFPRARAVTVNDWTLRAYQSVGLDVDLKADMEENGVLHWQTYAGKEVFRLMPADSGLGHPSSMMIYQPAMEATLRRGVERFPSVDVRFGVSVTGVEQDADGVRVLVSPTDGGPPQTLRATYVLACDGGSSTLRAALGVDLLGSTLEQDWIVIDAEVLRWWPNCKELVFWTDPDRPVVDIPLAMGYHRWEFPLRPSERKEDFDSDEAIWSLLEPMGRTRDQVRIKQHAFYVHHVRTAERWRVGRVLLLGDAAHLMPPWAGQGMQSGIRDAHNVSWKLAEVLAGRLDDSILDTYQQERAPQVALVTEVSGKLGMLIASRDPKFVRIRNLVGPVLKRLTFLTSRALGSGAPVVTAGWLRGATGRKSAVGRMPPQPPMCTVSGRHTRLDDALGAGFAVLGLDVDPRSLMSDSDIAGWEALGARFFAIRPADGSAATDDDLVDTTGAFGRWAKGYGARVLALRPDRFVAAADTGGMATPTEVRSAPSTTTAPHDPPAGASLAPATTSA